MSGSLIACACSRSTYGAVEKDQEDAIPGIRQRLHHVALRARLGAGGVRTDGRDDVLEGLDLLEARRPRAPRSRRPEALDDPAVLRRVDVDADEVRADADRLLRLGREDGEAAREKRDDRQRRRMAYLTTRMALTTRCDFAVPTTSISMA